MPCYFPQPNYISKDQTDSFGKVKVTRKYSDGTGEVAYKGKCGQCIGCRLRVSREWGIRAMHEASEYTKNCFLTLTYDNEHLPSDGGLHQSHMKQFFDSLLERFEGFTTVPIKNKKTGLYELRNPIRRLYCGEYGSVNLRPHWHAIVFNFDFEDKELFKKSPSGFPIYTSKELSRLWPHGFASIGECNFETASYVARYTTKKIFGETDAYDRIDRDTGELVKVRPPYVSFSRAYFIGRGWYDKYHEEMFRDDHVIYKGKELPVPRTYNDALKKEDPEWYDEVLDRRLDASNEFWRKKKFQNSYEKELYLENAWKVFTKKIDSTLNQYRDKV